ncbi:DUF1398 domain-containing protein [Pedobacter foliorum]|uniref:DUF1398 domain-containing protein n=1 Tax=Pedobacter foliorum TaxID=2739058 RepID=UPI001566FAFB|nr:DUF1398 family protein [Pedobacter foliorum]NRF37637.1 DUF1398 family protein [Pedobacter foliorum]
MFSFLQDPNVKPQFTLAQIRAAHEQVKSGADFPQYIQDIIVLGVKKFETYVVDSHTLYFGVDGYQTQSGPQYEELTIAEQSSKALFTSYLLQHQQGGSDYFTFCRHCAQTGVEKWIVDLTEMSCVYYDRAGHQILVEMIPTP